MTETLELARAVGVALVSSWFGYCYGVFRRRRNAASSPAKREAAMREAEELARRSSRPPLVPRRPMDRTTERVKLCLSCKGLVRERPGRSCLAPALHDRPRAPGELQDRDRRPDG